MSYSSRISGWNRITRGRCELTIVEAETKIISAVGIPRGNGQSYGDAAVNFSDRIFKVQQKPFIPFSDNGSSIVVSAGSTIRQICEYLAHSFRFLEIVPGSIDATIGGCIAADVHGKNDPTYGSFGNSIIRLEIMDHLGKREVLNSDSEFKMVVAGYGLTGLITWVEIKTRSIPSKNLKIECYITNGFSEFFQQMNKADENHEFTVGWLDFSSKDRIRGYVETANWMVVDKSKSRTSSINIKFPNLYINFFNPFVIKIYNSFTFYSAKRRSKRPNLLTSYQNYLFPLHFLKNWNHAFGKHGFHEIQLLIQNENIIDAMQDFKNVSERFPVFLVGIKKISQNGKGLLSFTKPGWSVAVNIPGKYISIIQVREILEFFWRKYSAKQYLAKDVVLDWQLFKEMYPQIEDFKNYRKLNNLEIFQSEMSKRLHI
jgi:decaprenylphospho-beta-D-ribofuranose 2-oxidase